MKSSVIKLGASALSGLAFATALLNATPITGSLDISYQAPLVDLTHTATNSLLAATGAGAATGLVVAGDMAYGTTVGASVSFNAFDWNPVLNPSPVTLWSFTSGAGTYSFSLTNLLNVTQTSTFLNISGAGVFSIAGVDSFTPTGGLWSYTITSSNGVANTDGKFTATSSNSVLPAGADTPVPDGGSTAVLIGLSFLGLGALARRRHVSDK
jgi:VPDSG-CTERM motif